MAEVKTFKCDICGEVYYSDDVKTAAIITVTEPSEKEDEAPEVNTYRNICPKCVGNINKLLDAPGVLEKLGNTAQKLKIGLRELYGKFFYRSGTPIRSMDDPTIDKMFAGIVHEINVAQEMYSQKQKELAEARSSRDLWKRLASVFMGLTTGMVIGLILIAIA